MTPWKYLLAVNLVFAAIVVVALLKVARNASRAAGTAEEDGDEDPETEMERDAKRASAMALRKWEKELETRASNRS